MKTISEKDLEAFLRAIESGQIKLKAQEEPQSIYAGNIEYFASNGWRIMVFNDANEWDYIEAIWDSHGNLKEEVDLASGQRISIVDFNYQPGEQASWTYYGIPGYMNFRCIACGTLLKGHLRGQPFLCDGCTKPPA